MCPRCGESRGEYEILESMRSYLEGRNDGLIGYYNTKWELFNCEAKKV